MDQHLRQQAAEATGFMPDDEGLVLYEAGAEAAPLGPLLEIGSYCGKSTIYLGAAAQQAGTTLYSVDHHRGSEEQQPGWEHHDERLIDPRSGRFDTLPWFRRAVADAALEATVVALVGDSPRFARHWGTPLALVFIDGGHAEQYAQADYEGWTPHLMPGGLLAIHDVFPDPADGGQAPSHIYQRAIASGDFEQLRTVGSLRILRRLTGTKRRISARGRS
mgnify:CR=1 FL=1|jgi:predicted O-methyltransferase YrrM